MQSLENIIESSLDNDFSNLFSDDSPADVEQASVVEVAAPVVMPYEQAKAKLKEEGLSFQQPIQEVEEKPKPKTGKKFIIYSQFIDKFNSKAIRREVTPSVCTVCGFDVAEQKHGRWGLVPAAERPIVQAALEAHKKAVHSFNDMHIIDESELPKQWLGNNRL